MTSWSKTQEIILTVASIPSGLLSFFSSMTIIIMILRSSVKLHKPLQRIIFGLSLNDLLSSTAAISSAFVSPKGTRWGAIGNEGTCTAHAILQQAGGLGSPLYSFALALYYLSIIKFSMTDRKFKDRFEIYLHLFSNIYIWFSVIFLSIKESFNFTRANCWIGPTPIDCIHDPNVDCVGGSGNAYLYQWLFAGIAVLISFLWNLLVIFILIRDIVRFRRRLNALSSSWRNVRANNDANIESQQGGFKLYRRLSSQLSSLCNSAQSAISRSNIPPSSNNEVADIPRDSFVFRRSSTSTRSESNHQDNMKHDLMVQALLYSISYVVVYIFSYIYRLNVQINGEDNANFIIVLLSRVMFPLQGFLNILIYTRISVSRLHSSSDFSWLQSFWIVISSALDQEDIAKKRRNTMIGETSADIRRTTAGGIKFGDRRKSSLSHYNKSEELPVVPNLLLSDKKQSSIPLEFPIQSRIEDKDVRFLEDDHSFKIVENIESDDHSFMKDEDCEFLSGYICSSSEEDDEEQELSHIEEDTLGANWEKREHVDNSNTKESLLDDRGINQLTIKEG